MPWPTGWPVCSNCLSPRGAQWLTHDKRHDHACLFLSQVEGSPYGGMAYCEQFPRGYEPGALDNKPEWPVHLAQVCGCAFVLVVWALWRLQLCDVLVIAREHTIKHHLLTMGGNHCYVLLLTAGRQAVAPVRPFR